MSKVDSQSWEIKSQKHLYVVQAVHVCSADISDNAYHFAHSGQSPTRCFLQVGSWHLEHTVFDFDRQSFLNLYPGLPTSSLMHWLHRFLLVGRRCSSSSCTFSVGMSSAILSIVFLERPFVLLRCTRGSKRDSAKSHPSSKEFTFTSFFIL